MLKILYLFRMYKLVICVCISILTLQTYASENVSIDVKEYEVDVNIYAFSSGANYSVGVDTGNGNITWQDIQTGSSTAYLSHTFSGLKPGRRYMIQVDKDGILIDNSTITTRPLPPINVSISDAGTTFLFLTWMLDPESSQDTIKVKVTSNLSNVLEKDLPSSQTSYNITQLLPGRDYAVSVETSSRGVLSNTSVSVDDDTVPSIPAIILITALDNRSLLIVTQPNLYRDDVEYTATYNDTTGAQKVLPLHCQIVLHHCLTEVFSGRPGINLAIRAYARKGTRRSPPDMVIHSTKPNPVEGVQEGSGSTTYLQLKLTPPINSYFTHYNIHVEEVINNEDNLSERNLTLQSTEKDFFLWNLTAGTTYNVSITASSEWENSEIIYGVFNTAPNPIDAINIDEVTNTAVTVTWAAPVEGGLDSYHIAIEPKETYTISPLVEYNVTDREETFSNLTAGKFYTITVVVYQGKKTSKPFRVAFWTRPYAPQNLNVTVRSNREVDADWAQPSEGMVDNYTIFIISQNNTDAQFQSMEFVVTDTFYRFTNLHPGETYNISVQSNSGNAHSDLVFDTATTEMSTVAELFIDFVDFDVINVTWPKPNGSIFDSYELSISPPTGDNHSTFLISESSGIVHYSFTQLTPGRLYNISIATVSGGVKSDQAIISVVTYPEPVQDLNVTSHDPTTLNLEWRVQDPLQQHHFLVQYHDAETKGTTGNQTLPMVIALHDQFVYSAHILDLYPGHKYTVYIQAKQDINNLVQYSPWTVANKTTKPLQVVDLTYKLNDFNVELSWLPNVSSTQDIYFIWYRAMMPQFSSSWQQNSTQAESFVLTHLFPGLRYEMVVFAVSHEETSLPSRVTMQLAPLPPANITADNVTPTSFELKWVFNEFSTYVESWVIIYTDITNDDSKNITVTAVTNQTDWSVTLDNLASGHTYNVTMYSVVSDVTSKQVQLNVTARPQCKTTLTLGVDSTKSVTVFYSQESNFFDYYIFRLMNTSLEIKKNKADPLRRVEFDDLSGGIPYVVEVVTVSQDQTSEPITLQAHTLPNNPRVDRISRKDSITLKLNKPEGRVDAYMVVCSPNCGSNTYQANNPVVTIDFTNLIPYTSYRFQIETRAGTKQSSLFLNIQTSESAPGMVQNLMAVEPLALTANVSWSPPQTTNGQITAYIVQYYTYAENGQQADSGSQNKTVGNMMSSQSVVFSNLKAGYKYIFLVYAKTIEIGEVATVELQLRTYHPPMKDGMTISQAKPKKLSKGENLVTASSMKVYFANAFSEKYGKIINYTVIVAMDTDDIYFNTNILPDWKSAQNDPSIKAYQAIANCSDFFIFGSTCVWETALASGPVEDHRVFEIGKDTSCTNSHYCNGPLKQNTRYYIKLRAYTTGGYSDTEYSEPIVTGMVPPPEEPSPVGIIVGVLVVIIAVLIIIVVIIYLKRRKDNKGNMSRSPGFGANLTPRSSMRVIKKSHMVQIGDFKEYVKSLSADSDFKYAEHFEELKEVGRDQACYAAELPVNRGKNRFTNILPYDHSRVKLLPTDDEEGSDYINANYVPGFNSKREYIVTQGPLPSTRDDFWRMIWEQNVRNIVMLTRCTEKGREKCDHYWPMGSDAIFYGDLQVAALNEIKFPSWSVTEFRVAYGNLTRQVRHFHFTAWPDFGVPERPATLVRFVRMVREKLIKECGPILVHCSAGVGRSGTFIVLDRLLQQICEQDTVDIFAIVHELRKERMWMVQTEQQYVCIHQCLLCVLEGREEDHVYQNMGVSNNAFEDDEGINIELT